MNTDFQILGENIRRVRQRLNLSQETLAGMCGLHRSYICDIERGTRNLSVGSLLKLAQGLGTTISEITRNVGSGACPRLGPDIGRTVLTPAKLTPTKLRQPQTSARVFNSL
jgi:transcriptional regulator with XRE-family HTH domain